jgi:hypothetical protein
MTPTLRYWHLLQYSTSCHQVWPTTQDTAMLGFHFVIIVVTLVIGLSHHAWGYLFLLGLTRVLSALYHRMTWLLPHCSPIAPHLHWLSFALGLEMQCWPLLPFLYLFFIPFFFGTCNKGNGSDKLSKVWCNSPKQRGLADSSIERGYNNWFSKEEEVRLSTEGIQGLWCQKETLRRFPTTWMMSWSITSGFIRGYLCSDIRSKSRYLGLSWWSEYFFSVNWVWKFDNSVGCLWKLFYF